VFAVGWRRLFSNTTKITHGFGGTPRVERFETVPHVRSGQIVSKYFLTGLGKQKRDLRIRDVK
jgi:hypothetical protein